MARRLNKPSCRIAVLGLNPAFQNILFFKEFHPGHINRAHEKYSCPAGKGINFARAALLNGFDSTVFQFTGGETGKKIKSELKKENIGFFIRPASGETRTCTTCIDLETGKCTEIIEPSPKIPARSSKELLGRIINEMETFTALAICGTAPSGVKTDFYRLAVESAVSSGKLILLDAWENMDKVIAAGVHILKINSSELCRLTGREEIQEAGRYCMKKYPLECLAVTCGKDPAYLFADNKVSVLPVPHVSKVINPIGSGDTVSAVLLTEYLRTGDYFNSFKKALKAGSANCETPIPGQFKI